MKYYQDKILERFLHPKHLGKIENPDGFGSTQNLKCGDVMKIYLKVKDDVIEDIKFETLGCGHAIASSDMICDLALGKTIEQAKEVKFKDVLKELGDMPPQKIHCTSLAELALNEAIKDYEKSNHSPVGRS